MLSFRNTGIYESGTENYHVFASTWFCARLWFTELFTIVCFSVWVNINFGIMARIRYAQFANLVFGRVQFIVLRNFSSHNGIHERISLILSRSFVVRFKIDAHLLRFRFVTQNSDIRLWIIEWMALLFSESFGLRRTIRFFSGRIEFLEMYNLEECKSLKIIECNIDVVYLCWCEKNYVIGQVRCFVRECHFRSDLCFWFLRLLPQLTI